MSYALLDHRKVLEKVCDLFDTLDTDIALRKPGQPQDDTLDGPRCFLDGIDYDYDSTTDTDGPIAASIVVYISVYVDHQTTASDAFQLETLCSTVISKMCFQHVTDTDSTHAITLESPTVTCLKDSDDDGTRAAQIAIRGTVERISGTTLS